MWWAKYFGIYGQENALINSGGIYLGIKDMCVEKFDANDQKKIHHFLLLTMASLKSRRKYFKQMVIIVVSGHL